MSDPIALSEEESELEENSPETLRMSNDRWKNRRRMAWTSLVSMIIVTFLAFFLIPLERLKLLDNVITWYYTICGSIVMGYCGLSVLDDKWQKPTGKKE